MNQSWCQSVEEFDSFPRHLNLWPPKTPQNAPWGIVGRLVFSIYLFPDESADVNQSWCQSVQPFDSFSRLLNVWPPKTPSAPCVSKGNLFGVYPFPDESAHVCQIWCQSVQPFDSFNRLLNLWPPKTPKMPPGILRSELYLAYVHSQTNPQTCTTFGVNQSSCLTASSDFWIGYPPETPWGIEGRIVFSLCPFPDESADLYQMWCQSVQPFDSFLASPNIWICDPLKHPKCPWGIVGRIVFSLCPFPDESADVYQIWCQSVQRFDSFPRLLDLWPPTPPPPNAPMGYWGVTWILPMPIPRWIRWREPKLVPIGPAVWQLPKAF